MYHSAGYFRNDLLAQSKGEVREDLELYKGWGCYMLEVFSPTESSSQNEP